MAHVGVGSTGPWPWGKGTRTLGEEIPSCDFGYVVVAGS